MTKQLRFCLSFFMIINFALLQASSFRVAIPQSLVKKNATLLLLVSDSDGKQFFRKYRLGNVKAGTIRQEELEIATENNEMNGNVIEILSDLALSDTSNQDAVVVCFQLDDQYRVLRVMVLKDTLFEDNPFDVVALSVSSEIEFDQFYEEMQNVDALEQLTNDLKNCDVSNIHNQPEIAWFEKYMLYAKIFTYEVTKAVSSVWWK
ncbi:hypothetical protein HYV10_00620 [Candidatus Dependentiae bacterium]|nr:hypothetical protein [Candidatus Dependentiae bacterium]